MNTMKESSQMINIWDLQEKMEAAEKKVVILGVTPLGDDFDWERFADIVSPKIANGSLELRVFRESDNFIYGKSLISENKEISGDIKSYSFTQLMYAYNAAIQELRKSIYKNCCENNRLRKEELEKSRKFYRTNFSVRTMCLDIPIPSIYIDGEYYITMSLTKFFSNDRLYEHIDSKNLWYDAYLKYFDAYLNNESCSKKYSATARYSDEGHDDEILELYDVDRVARGLYPRDCFYSTINSQLVIWDFVFSRNGKLLLHKRKWNAKDNVGMWDKSVGGHVDYSEDFDSTDAATRELIEELFTDEGVFQTHGAGINFHKENINAFIFLGDWNDAQRYDAPFKEIQDHPKQWYYFRLPKSTSIRRQSNRIMPPIFKDSNGMVIDAYDFKSYFTNDQLLELVKNGNLGKFNGLVDEQIMSKLEATDIMELLDQVRIKDGKVDLSEIVKPYGLTVSEDQEKELNVISDIYFFIADLSFNELTLKDLHNSEFLLLDIEEIKEMQKKGYRLSPDMQAMLSNSTGLRDSIERCVDFLRRMDKKSRR